MKFLASPIIPNAGQKRQTDPFCVPVPIFALFALSPLYMKQMALAYCGKKFFLLVSIFWPILEIALPSLQHVHFTLRPALWEPLKVSNTLERIVGHRGGRHWHLRAAAPGGRDRRHQRQRSTLLFSAT
ncbi:hypothetical protein EI94DRAFT_1724099 [Lactarius quietus]|nr:hypothetical protein EI94DRAFT_1724099 [Lactarius quietus]